MLAQKSVAKVRDAGIEGVAIPPGVQGAPAPSPHLARVLGRWDLILLFVVAVANLNIVPAIAASGALTLWIWGLAFIAYFWPQGVAVTELARRWPGEGGVYLWTCINFGEGHGFFAGWCYWLANVVYLPTVLLSCVGVGLYIFSPSVQSLASSERVTGGMALALLLGLLVLNVRGQQMGKWMTNIGGVGTVGGGILVCLLAAWTLHGQGSAAHLHDLNPRGASWRLIAVFGTICYSLQGLDLASIMGDEIREPRKVLPNAIVWGGIISGTIYLAVTFAMLVALPHSQIGVLSGVLQAVSTMADRAHLRMIVPPLALFEFLAILGTASAWFSGSARLPFVAGIHRYLPPSLGKIHPKFHTPYVALGLFALLSAMLILMSYAAASVGEAYLTLLSIAVILQMVPNLYMFAALWKTAALDAGPSRRGFLRWSAVSGLTASGLGICLAFVPTGEVLSVWAYEAKLISVSILVVGFALFFYFRAQMQRGAVAPAKH